MSRADWAALAALLVVGASGALTLRYRAQLLAELRGIRRALQAGRRHQHERGGDHEPRERGD